MAMHTTRNRSALHSFSRASVAFSGPVPKGPGSPRLNKREGQAMPPTKSLKSAKARQPDANRPFMLANGSEPRFPEDILIAPPSLPGAAIADAPGIDAAGKAMQPAEKPAADSGRGKATAKKAKRTRKGATAKKVRTSRKSKRTVARKTARAGTGSGVATPPVTEPEAAVLLLTYSPPLPVSVPDVSGNAGSPVMPPPPIPMPMRPMQPTASLTGGLPAIGSSLSVTFHTTAEHEAPARNLPDDREPYVPLSRQRSVTTQGEGLVSRLVTWLGKLLPRRKRKSAMPRSRRALNQTQTAVRPSEQAEIDRLRRENKRLRGEIARLAQSRLDAAAGVGKPPAA